VTSQPSAQRQRRLNWRVLLVLMFLWGAGLADSAGWTFTAALGAFFLIASFVLYGIERNRETP